MSMDTELSAEHHSKNNKPHLTQHDTLIYVGDPMCSWCYGFSPELDQIKAAFPDLPFEMVMGGLRAGGNETMMELGEFLHHHWIDVQKASGQPFNFAILSQSTVTYDTEPACRATIIVRDMMPEQTYAYFKEIQKGFYFYNNLPNDIDSYLQPAMKLGIDHNLFVTRYNSQEAKMAAYEDFELAQKMGVQGFPALILKSGDKYYKITDGYQKASVCIAKITKAVGR